jgi:hypothetical protein
LDFRTYRYLLVLPVLIPLLPVKITNPLHVFFCQFEIEDVVILCDMVRIGGARYGNKAGLQLPPKDNLRRRLSVLFCQFFDYFIPEMF